MNRRDTIIIAVLINAGLLIVLFATALKSSPDPEPQQEIAAIASPITEVTLPSIAPPVHDEVDQVLKEHPNPAAIVAAPVDFTQDLQTIAMPEAPAAALPIPEVTEVKVKKGDFLAKIARVHHTTVADIMRENNLSSTNLKIGQTLRIPKGKSVARSTESKYYVVKNGDNPWTIAVKNKMKVDELLKLNNLNEEKARHLKPGDKLLIQ